MNRTHASVIVMLTLSACSSDTFRRNAYEALHQKQCIDRTGAPNCDPQHPSYDEYQHDRDAVLKREQ